MSKTIDEKFLIKLYEIAKTKDNYEAEIDCLEVGRAIGQREKTTKTIVKLLAQANFIRKIDSNIIQLTQNGIRLAEELING